MPSILAMKIGFHYLQSNYDFPTSIAAKIEIENLLRHGLIEKHGNGYRKSDALHRWIKALEAVPFPVIE